MWAEAECDCPNIYSDDEDTCCCQFDALVVQCTEEVVIDNGSWLGMGVLIWAARMAWAMAVISKLEASSSSSAAEFPQCMRNRPYYAVRALPAVTKLARLLRSNSAVEWCHDQPIFRPMRWMQCRCEPRMTMLGRVGNRICRTACVKLRCWKLDLLHGVFRFDLW